MKNILFVLLLISALGFSQETSEKDLKIGLVLSGGGAKGLAHIGALKIIEESGVRIDYIGGTSMGAIIGALYASGYSAKELDSIFSNTDFSTLIQDDIPRKTKTFYEKEESERYAVALPFDNLKLAFPSGLSKGQNVYNLFSKLTSHVNDISDFSKLPIPFFCVATNVETGRELILEKGYLPRAVTASGALPSLFSPVVIDDAVLIDGGVVNNYPVDQVRAKGMDIIIGVDVQDSLKTRENLQSAFSVLIQINNYRTINDMREKRKKTDIYIHPNIKDFSVVSFDAGRKIIESGEIEASNYKKLLERLASEQSNIPQKKVKIKIKDTLHIKEVILEGNEKYSRAYVLGKLKLKTPAETTYEKFSIGINNLSATGNFQGINYRFIDDEDDKTSVLLQLRESKARMLLRLGAHYDDLYRAAALINVTRKRNLTNNDIASLDLIVGDNLRYNFNYYIDKGYYWSVGFNSSYNYFEKNVAPSYVSAEIPENDIMLNEIALTYSDFTNQLYVTTLFRRIFNLGVGAEHKYLRYLSETIGVDDDLLPRTVFESTNYYSAYGFLKYDTFDNSIFPNSGIYFEGDFHLYLFAHGKNDNFDQFSIAKAKIGYAKSFLDKFSAVITTEGGFKIGNENTRTLDFSLGGYGYKEINNIVPFYGYESLRLRGDTYLKSSLTLDYEFLRKNHFNVTANIANVGDDLFTDGKWIDAVDYTGIALGYGMETFFGPLELKYTFSPDTDNSTWFVNVGYKF